MVVVVVVAAVLSSLAPSSSAFGKADPFVKSACYLNVGEDTFGEMVRRITEAVEKGVEGNVVRVSGLVAECEGDGLHPAEDERWKVCLPQSGYCGSKESGIPERGWQGESIGKWTCGGEAPLSSVIWRDPDCQLVHCMRQHDPSAWGYEVCRFEWTLVPLVPEKEGTTTAGGEEAAWAETLFNQTVARVESGDAYKSWTGEVSEEELFAMHRHEKVTDILSHRYVPLYFGEWPWEDSRKRWRDRFPDLFGRIQERERAQEERAEVAAWCSRPREFEELVKEDPSERGDEVRAKNCPMEVHTLFARSVYRMSVAAVGAAKTVIVNAILLYFTGVVGLMVVFAPLAVCKWSVRELRR